MPLDGLMRVLIEFFTGFGDIGGASKPGRCRDAHFVRLQGWEGGSRKLANRCIPQNAGL